jgi:hypothetical protein
METFVLAATALGSTGIMPLRLRARAFYVLFLHLLLVLTVGSLALRTLSRGGTLLIPFWENCHYSPYMHLDKGRVYALLAVSIGSLILVCGAKRRLIVAPPKQSAQSMSFVDSPYCCLLFLWVHLLTIIGILTFGF